MLSYFLCTVLSVHAVHLASAYIHSVGSATALSKQTVTTHTIYFCVSSCNCADGSNKGLYAHILNYLLCPGGMEKDGGFTTCACADGSVVENSGFKDNAAVSYNL